jgi:BirA family biotin operon repressor/biotin-[acetyl-CoA-carboxylase] ligase
MAAMIRVVGVTGSTNADLLAAARAGEPEGVWLRADRQTAGRGRAQRFWVSASGNLHASTLVRLRPGDPPAPGLALMAGVAMQEALAAHAPGLVLRLKWPNDLLAGEAKVAGILLEREGEAVVIGFGINLATHPEGMDRPTADLGSLAGSAPDPDALLLTLAAAVARWLARWRVEGLAPVRQRWLDCAHPVGSALAVSGAHGRMEGLFDGLERDGALRLRRADRSVEIVRAGDVQLI